ncbi:hypothetical protein PG984_011976 [Apiospora sp. TS-2023a]
MMATKKMLQNLVDLRELYRDSREVLIFHLQNQEIVHFDAATARVAKKDEIGSTNGLDLLLRVVRHLLSHLPDDFYGPAPGEDPNPLLELAWADLGCDNGFHTHKARVDVLGAFFPDQDLTKQDLSFEVLANHELMHKTLWRRFPFLLFDPQTWSRQTGEQGESFKPDDSAEQTKEWLTGLAQQSLVSCNTAEFPSLKAAVEDSFGIFSDPSRGRDYFFQFNEPAIIRTRYVCSLGPSNVENVMTLDNGRLVDGETPGKAVLPAPGANAMAYNKIAAVHLHKKPNPDFLELFLLDGTPVPVIQEGERARGGCANYMFFYVQAPPFNIRALPGVSRPFNFDAIFNELSVIAGDTKDPSKAKRPRQNKDKASTAASASPSVGRGSQVATRGSQPRKLAPKSVWVVLHLSEILALAEVAEAEAPIET